MVGEPPCSLTAVVGEEADFQKDQKPVEGVVAEGVVVVLP